MSPQYANFLGALAMGAVAVGYLLNPLTMGYMVQNHVSRKLNFTRSYHLINLTFLRTLDFQLV